MTVTFELLLLLFKVSFLNCNPEKLEEDLILKFDLHIFSTGLGGNKHHLKKVYLESEDQIQGRWDLTPKN